MTRIDLGCLRHRHEYRRENKPRAKAPFDYGVPTYRYLLLQARALQLYLFDKPLTIMALLKLKNLCPNQGQ